MKLPAKIRVFFAVAFPSHLKEQIDEFIKMLKKKVPSHCIRWTKPDHLHITLQFLAELHTTDLPVLLAQVREQLSGEKRIFHFHLGELRVFPHIYRPRVIVLDVQPQSSFELLSSCIGKGIQATGYAIEAQHFRAHLTLGRIKHAQAFNFTLLKEIKPPAIVPLKVQEIVLFRSEPQQEGSLYTILEKIPLEE